ncbi:MAG: glutamate-5-semialdehyde dehydrogenase [Candidatus Methylacidiphilales bacterium]
MSNVRETVEAMGPPARAAARFLAKASAAQKNALLESIASALDSARETIAEANQRDVERGRAAGLSEALIDRLTLTPKRMDAMIAGVRDVMALPDPVGERLKAWRLPNGLEMEKVRVPIGVIGIIYESRPNVTIDASVLCLKTGNATILRGGSEALESNRALVAAVGAACRAEGVPEAVVSLVPTTDREAIPALCEMDGYLDLMIPRGGHGLIETVVRHARMPVIKHYHGVCQIYVHASADPAMAESIVVNAKCQRPGVCNAAETLLMDRSIAPTLLPRLARALLDRGVELRGDAEVAGWVGRPLKEPENWTTEYLDLILAIRLVNGLDEAIDHIETHGSHHSDTIVASDRDVAERFLAEVDSAAVYWNASTRFTDGAQFGFGAEIGISTDKIHARGPMGLEELTSYKYIARGTGQIRH